MIPCEVVEVEESVAAKAALQENVAVEMQEQPFGAVSIPCEVVIANYEAPAQVSYPVVGIRAVPTNKSKQILRLYEDTVVDTFTVFYAESGMIVDVDRFDFIFTLRSKSDNSVLYRLPFRSKDASIGTVSFAPTMAQASLVGFFTYSVQVINTDGEMQTIVDGSYVYKKSY